MTILQGTMSDGTLVPIQADSQGRLVAEGLQGPQGPQGPPGVGQLPPNPQNGDVLAWDNGLIWVSGIIPAGRPQTDEITAVDFMAGIATSVNADVAPISGNISDVLVDNNLGVYYEADKLVTFTFNAPISMKDLRVYCFPGAAGASQDWSLNGTKGVVNVNVITTATAEYPNSAQVCDIDDTCTSFTVTASGSVWGIAYFSNEKSGKTTLTFASNKDLAKFAAGDAVSQENSTGTPVYSDGLQMLAGSSLRAGSSAANAFDGSDATTAVFDGNSPVGGGYEITFNPPVSGNSVKITGYKDTRASEGSPQLALSVNGGTPVVFNDGTSGQFVETFTVGGSLNSIKFVLTKSGTSAAGQGIALVEVDNVALVDGAGLEPRGTVGSVDTTANTMTLATSNGTWGPPNAGHYVLGPVVARYAAPLTPHR